MQNTSLIVINIHSRAASTKESMMICDNALQLNAIIRHELFFFFRERRKGVHAIVLDK